MKLDTTWLRVGCSTMGLTWLDGGSVVPEAGATSHTEIGAAVNANPLIGSIIFPQEPQTNPEGPHALQAYPQ